MNKIRLLLFISVLQVCQLAVVGQSSNDTLQYLSKISKGYLDLIFNKQLIDSAATYWTENIYDELSGGYNNGKIRYDGEKNLLDLFRKDIQSFLTKKRQKIQFVRTGKADLLNDDDNNIKHFLISFKAEKVPWEDKKLNTFSLDLISKDKGRTWRVNNDHWIGKFMYSMYAKK